MSEVDGYEDLIRTICMNHADEMRLEADGTPAGQYVPDARPASDVVIEKLHRAGHSADHRDRLPTYNQIGEMIRSLDPVVAERVGLENPLPPKGIHWMGKKKGLFFDIQNADVIGDALRQAGLKPRAGGRYLDFGCSSGRTVRSLAMTYPEGEWIGGDPVPSSIEWAKERVKEGTFFVSPEKPPIAGMSDGALDGAVALSIWSHFSEELGKAWLAEMHRLIKPGGFMLLTTQGYLHIVRLASGRKYPVEVLRAAYEGLKKDGFYFHRFYESETNSKGLQTAHWGLTFMTVDWVRADLARLGWRMRYSTYGAWGSKQDVHVLERLDGPTEKIAMDEGGSAETSAVKGAAVAPASGVQRHFVIMASQRTGSNMVVNALNGHPRIRCHGELMRKGNPELKGALGIVRQIDPVFLDEGYRHANPRPYIESVFALDRDSAFQGFKLMLRDNPEFLKTLVDDRSFAKILLYRENILAAWSSQRIARVTGQGIAGRFAEVKTAKVPFDAGDFTTFRKRWEKSFADTREALRASGQNWLEIEYKEAADESGRRRIVEFIGADPGVELVVHTKKRNPGDICDRFTNPDEAEAWLKDNGLQHWAREG